MTRRIYVYLGIPLTQVAQDVVWQPEWTITLGT